MKFMKFTDNQAAKFAARRPEMETLIIDKVCFISNKME